MAEVKLTSDVEKLLSKCALTMQRLKKKKIVPMLAFIQVGEKPADNAFIKAQSMVLHKLGCDSIVGKLSEEDDIKDLEEGLKSLNSANYIHGIISCRPMAKNEFNQAIFELTGPSKDIDGASYINQGRLMSGSAEGYAPTTAEVLAMLCERFSENLEGKKICIINNSDLIGKPLSVMLSRKMASVSILNHCSAPEDIKAECLSSDIVIVGAPAENLLTEDMVRPQSCVINAAYLPGGKCSCTEGLVSSVNCYVSPSSVGKMTTALNAAKLISICSKKYL